MSRLSVIVITRNEARNIAACLRSVSFADQLVVVDSGSTDGTVEIAGQLGAEVVRYPDWQGFGIQKNRALACANGDWVLSIDADERVTPELQSEVLQAIRHPQCDAYSFPRLSSYCGQYIRHSGWHPDRITRLFLRGSARFSEELVHEKLVTTGKVGQLTASLLHESFVDLEAVLDKANRYSTAGAEMLRQRGEHASLAKALGHGAWAFFRTYVLRRGFLDGRMGLVLAISNAEGTYYRYLKLWLLAHSTVGNTPSGK